MLDILQRHRASHVDLVVGDQSGKVGVISNFNTIVSGEAVPEFKLIYNELTETYSDKNLGGKIWPVVVNLFNTNKPAVVVGNGLGGIHVLKNDEGAYLPDRPEVQLFPNPVDQKEQLTVRVDRYGTMQIVSVLGQQLSKPVVLRANEIHHYTLPPLAAGLYLLKFSAGKNPIHSALSSSRQRSRWLMSICLLKISSYPCTRSGVSR